MSVKRNPIDLSDWKEPSLRVKHKIEPEIVYTYKDKNGVEKRYPNRTKRSQKQNNAWHHNGLIGRTAMSIAAMQAIIDSDTTTKRQKQMAEQVQSKLYALSNHLQHRRID